MLRTTSAASILALVLWGGTALRASEATELRDKATAFQAAASVLAEQGQIEAAERLEREARKLLREAERQEAHGGQDIPRHEIEREVSHLERRLQDLLARERELHEAEAPEGERAEVRAQVAWTERELHALRERLGRDDGPRPSSKPRPARSRRRPGASTTSGSPPRTSRRPAFTTWPSRSPRRPRSWGERSGRQSGGSPSRTTGPMVPTLVGRRSGS